MLCKVTHALRSMQSQPRTQVQIQGGQSQYDAIKKKNLCLVESHLYTQVLMVKCNY